MRVVTRPSTENAGDYPILRVASRFANMPHMENGPVIDTPKLKRAIIEHTGPGKPFTRRKLSLLASDKKNPDLIRDLFRGQDKRVTLETASGLIAAMGLDLSDYVRAPVLKEGAETITVRAAVEAGVWREQSEWPDEQRYEVEVAPSPISGERFGLVVVGRSMNRTFPPGTVLDCFRVPFATDNRLQPQPGDIVIVERQQNGLFETTCKRLRRADNGDWFLEAESYDSEFDGIIPIGQPGDHCDDEVRIVGIVNAAIQQHLQRAAS